MEPEAPFRGQVFTVTAITLALKQMMEGVFRDVFVEGEVSSLREAASGHIYFDLKDRESLLSAVMFKWDARKYGFELQEGVQVRVWGSLSCYAKQGRYQIVVKTAEALAKGNLFLEFEKLKKKLEAEGLFAPEHKKEIPAYPQRIGVVTSPTGAAVRDILSVLKRRSPHLEIIIAPVLVQGEEAAGQIAQAIADLNRFKPAPDVLLVGRGGGSMEDLWAFNEEIVARAIYKSKIPVISCVGHEVDFTIADFVADLRAPTPSAAAELVVQNSQNTRQYIRQLQKRLLQSVSLFYERARNRFDQALNSRVFKNPETIFQAKEQELDDLSLRLENAWKEKLSNFTHRFELARNQLQALGPQAVLKRGYSITRKADGSVISRVGQTAPGETVFIQVQDGMIRSEVK
ncbi:exodeoxyribonuclease VII large subunit [Candidatus Avelusimicrobium gallicola]|uniref:Exodeoxyribonuclease 7 large subunit n=1 Tax=Candidatus Avelusimicrobium gallicola TaxID=2562704 RepID=A0A1Y4DEQ2_9BACT|nr:exodeoxyribonuclease VII large subunit [Elusimicrobium sp. An273]OUO57604.1 exodeoxyribonuclease VII large subunit [Elusimicrobium sp. An273]